MNLSMISTIGVSKIISKKNPLFFLREKLNYVAFQLKIFLMKLIIFTYAIMYFMINVIIYSNNNLIIL